MRISQIRVWIGELETVLCRFANADGQGVCSKTIVISPTTAWRSYLRRETVVLSCTPYFMYSAILSKLLASL